MSNATAEGALPLLKRYSRAPSPCIVRISAAGYRFQWPEPSASSGLAAEEQEQATSAVRGLAIRAGLGSARPSFGHRAINSSASNRCFK